MNDARVKALNDVFVQTLSTNPATIKSAEAQLQEFTKQQGYAAAVLTVVSLDSPVELRQAAAVNFKNFVKFHWAPSEEDGLQISEPEKDQIKALITGLMLNTPLPVRAQLSEALTIIGEYEFPAKWPSLLPELLERLRGGDLATVAGVLETANSIYKRYRNQMMSTELSKDLEYSQQLVQPLLQTLQQLVKQLEGTPAGEAGPARQVLGSVRLVMRTFFSLNSPGLTEEFEKTLDAWMGEFHKLLTYENAALAAGGAGDRESPVDAVKAAVCQNINLLVSRDEEEFAKFLPTFVQDVWTQLVKLSAATNQDQLAKTAIQFLTTVARSARNAALFQSADVLRQVCEKIVIPNLRLSEDVEEMFDMNFVEYVRRDTEGSDYDTRRRAATELVKALAGQFEAEVTQLFTGYVEALFAEAAASPQAWKSKDVALYLVSALAVRGQTAARGATSTNQRLDIGQIFEKQVAGELQAGGGRQAILQADALKFVTTFRSQLPKQALLAAFPALVGLLRSESNVVHSYAAILIDRLLASKEGNRTRFSVPELLPCLQSLLENLFAAFSIDDSAENEYVMKCVMRVISFVGLQIAPVAPQCLEQLSKLLLTVCKNPTVPGFNHYLFESVAALIKNSASARAESVATLESMLFPPFQIVLSEDVQEFHPYVFQIFSQLLELRQPPVPATYMDLLRPLLTPALWERPGNVPALVRLTAAYLAKAAPQIMQMGLQLAILGIFQKLVASKQNDHEGFKLLQAIAASLPPETFDSYLPEVWKILFQRLQAAKTAKYVGGLIGFVAWLAVKRTPMAVYGSVEGIQPGLFRLLLEQVWLPGMATLKAQEQHKLVCVATTQILCDCPPLQTPAAAAFWSQMLQALLAVLSEGSLAQAKPEEDNDEAGFSGYAAAFAKLQNAAVAPQDPLPEVADAGRFFAESLAHLARAQPGWLGQVAQSQLPAEGQQQLQTYCQRFGISIA